MAQTGEFLSTYTYTPLLISSRVSRASITRAVRGYSGMQTRFAQQEGNLFAHASKCSFSFWTWIWFLGIRLKKSSLEFDKANELE